MKYGQLVIVYLLIAIIWSFKVKLYVVQVDVTVRSNVRFNIGIIFLHQRMGKYGSMKWNETKAKYM